ncbi:MAG: GGDEF domain-containing protein [Propionivibrio sp.]
MRKSNSVQENSPRRRVDMLMRSIMMWLFVAGALAIGVLWIFESKSGLIDDVCRIAYPLMLIVFISGTAMLYRWPDTVPIARWLGFFAITAFLVMELAAALANKGALVGNYPFISLTMWFPLAYSIALFLLDARHAPWAAGGLFVLVASVSFMHIQRLGPDATNDAVMLINLLTSHVVLLACLSGLVKIKLALFRTEAQSHRLFEQASTDPLTGLANRRYGMEMLYLAASEHTADAPSAVMLCDVDRFKSINDLHGHDVGDRVVQTIGAILRHNTREFDTVVRWGGDEFLIVVPQISVVALREMAERLRARVADLTLVDEKCRAVSPSLSIGVAEMADGESLERWIKRADEALYLAKSGGRNRCVFAHPIAEPAGALDAGRLAEPALSSDL